MPEIRKQAHSAMRYFKTSSAIALLHGMDEILTFFYLYSSMK